MKINLEKMGRFADATAKIRADFPEHSLEIDKCVFDAGQKIPCCGKPGCECQITFEEFHQAMNRKNFFDSFSRNTH
jgi:hypothetical protein